MNVLQTIIAVKAVNLLTEALANTTALKVGFFMYVTAYDRT